ncbi:MAG: hypothetical protein AB7V14_11680 [Kiritimatiellia bacterium]
MAIGWTEREEMTMSDKRLKYEKPMSIDLGRVAPILGDTCSVGNGAADCPAGMNNAVVAICSPSGSGADNDCRSGGSAGTYCWPTGAGAQVYCLAGSGYGSAEPAGMPPPGAESAVEPAGAEPVSTEPTSAEPVSSEPGAL